MKVRFLLPHFCLKIGWILGSIALLLHVVFIYSESAMFDIPVFAMYENQSPSDGHWFIVIINNVLDELMIITSIVALLLLAFSRRKNEDEYIQKLRMESLIWAVYLNFFILIFITVFFYGFVYLLLGMYWLFIVLVLFVLRFNFVLYRINKKEKSE